MIDPVLLSLVHQSMTQQQATPRDLPETMVETESASSVQIAPEQGEGQPEPGIESSLIPPTPLFTDLVVVTEPASQEITADFVFLTGAHAKTPFSLIVLMATTPAASKSSTMAMPQQSSPSAIVPPLLEVDFKDEFIEELIGGFHKSLKCYLSMIFKSTRTSFASWRPIFLRR